MQRIDPEKREEWEYQMYQPLPGHEPTEMQLQVEGDAFMAAMGALRKG